MDNPCYGYKDRHLRCHNDCSKFSDWKQSCDIIKDIIKKNRCEYYAMHDYEIERSKRIKMRRNRK